MGAVDEALAATAFKNLEPGMPPPERGTLLFCSSPRHSVSFGPPNDEGTLFTGALLSVLQGGSVSRPEMLSFGDLRELVYDRMLESSRARVPPRPALHQTDQQSGDLTGLPAFPNVAWARRKAEEEERATEARRKAEEEERATEARRKAEEEERATEARRKAEEEERTTEARRKAERAEEQRAAKVRRKAWNRWLLIAGIPLALVTCVIIYLMQSPSAVEAARNGSLAEQRKDYAQAMDWYRKAANQGNALAQTRIGDLYYNGQGVAQDYAQAMDWYRKAADQGNAHAQATLGDLYYYGRSVARDYARAMDWYRKAAEQGNANAQAKIGDLYYYGFGVTQDYAQAMVWYRKAADQGNADARAALAQLYSTTGRTDDAKKSYDELLSESPSDVTALLGLAEVAVAQRKWPEATDYLTRARTAAPNNPAPGLLLVNMYGSQQDWKHATSAAAELVAQFPGNIEVLNAQGWVQSAAGDTVGALSTYRRAHELAPESRPIFSRYLALLRDAKKFVEVRTVLQAALDRDPKDASLKGDLIRVEAEIGGLEAGLAKARGFANDDPGNRLYDVVSAELYANGGRKREAILLADQVAATQPSDDNVTLALFHLYSRVDDLKEAEGVLSARLKADSKDFTIRSALGAFYLEQKKYDAAITEYTRLLAEHPTDPTALNNLAWLYQRQNDLPKARELAERAFAADPAAAQIDDTLGWILLAQGEADKALTHLSAANFAAPRNPDIQYHLAVALQRVGRPTDAQAMLETLLGSGASFADKADAEKLLQELKRS